MKKSAFLSILLAIAIFSNAALACTTFCLKNRGEVLFGKNYDWMVGDGLVFVNRRGVHKISAEEKNPAKWISKYGSVTFNQYGWESPSGGMNEAGLVIELMWLDGTEYPTDDYKPSIDVLEWIQFQLDTAATTGEVVKSADNLRIDSRVQLHYLVNDKNGNSATIEFLGGKLVAHTGDKLPVATLTNDTYARSIEFATKNDASSRRTVSSLDRFTRAAVKTREFTGKDLGEKASVAYAFAALADAAQPNYTQWSIVYDQKRGKVYFRTLKFPQIRVIDTKSFDYACSQPVLTFEMNTSDKGNVNYLFTRYARSTNRGLIEASFSGTDFLKNVPAELKDSYTDFPERFTCTGVAPPKESAHTSVAPPTVSWLDIVFPIHDVYKRIAA